MKLKNLSLIALGPLLSSLINIFIHPYLSQIYPESNWEIFGLYTSYSNLFIPFTTLGYPLMSRFNERNNYISTVSVIIILPVLLSFLLVPDLLLKYAVLFAMEYAIFQLIYFKYIIEGRTLCVLFLYLSRTSVIVFLRLMFHEVSDMLIWSVIFGNLVMLIPWLSQLTKVTLLDITGVFKWKLKERLLMSTEMIINASIKFLPYLLLTSIFVHQDVSKYFYFMSLVIPVFQIMENVLSDYLMSLQEEKTFDNLFRTLMTLLIPTAGVLYIVVLVLWTSLRNYFGEFLWSSHHLLASLVVCSFCMMFVGVMSRRYFIAYRIRDSILLKLYSLSIHIGVLLICLNANLGLEIWLLLSGLVHAVFLFYKRNITYGVS